MDVIKKMERWIETRLWNQKMKNESITIRQIIFELSTLFKIDVTPEPITNSNERSNRSGPGFTNVMQVGEKSGPNGQIN